MNAFSSWFGLLLGLGAESKELTLLQISLRAVVVFVLALIMVRLSDRRSLTKKSPLDIIFMVMLASVLSRAINGSASCFGSIGRRRPGHSPSCPRLLPPAAGPG